MTLLSLCKLCTFMKYAKLCTFHLKSPQALGHLNQHIKKRNPINDYISKKDVLLEYGIILLLSVYCRLCIRCRLYTNSIHSNYIFKINYSLCELWTIKVQYIWKDYNKKKLKKKETHEISVLCNVLDRKVWVLFCNTGGESRGNRAIVNKLSTLTWKPNWSALFNNLNFLVHH